MNPLQKLKSWRTSSPEGAQKAHLATIGYYFRKYWRFYCVGIGALVIVDGLEALPPLLLKMAIDAITEKNLGPSLKGYLLQIVAIYMLVAVVQGLMRYLWRKYIVRTSMMSSPM